MPTTKLQSRHLMVAIDFGGSSTKTIYATLNEISSPTSLVMAPEAAQISPTSLEQFQITQLFTPAPEHSGWVKLGDNCWAVGTLAKRFHAHAGLNQPKFERALYKTLAAIWVIQQRLQFPHEFHLSLSCLLPPNEYEDRSRFEKQLRSALTRFETPSGELKVKLEQFDCQPEGAGIAIRYANSHKDKFSTQRIAIAMLGHRNASVIAFEQGALTVFKSSNLGFIRCLEQIEQRSSGQTSEPLLSAIVEWITSKMQSEEPFVAIARSTQPSNRTEEAKHLVAIARQARADYIRTITSWLQEVMPNSADEWVFAGGTTNLIATDLVKHFGQRLSFHADVEIPEAIDTDGLGHRLSDVWALFQYFCSVHPQLQPV